MSEIHITPNGVDLVEKVTVFGKTEEHREELERGKERTYDIRINTDEFVPLSDFLQVKYTASGEIESVIIGEDDNRISVSIRERENEQLPELKTPPPVPEVNDLKNKNREDYYRRLLNDGSQPAIIRKIIYSFEELERWELEEIMEAKGYQSSSGGIPSSLALLENDLGEIERIGRGPEQTIRWIGPTKPD
jgi:hypothetical protein